MQRCEIGMNKTNGKPNDEELGIEIQQPGKERICKNGRKRKVLERLKNCAKTNEFEKDRKRKTGR